MAYTKLIPHFTPGAKVEEYSDGDRGKAYRLFIPSGPADKYRVAQLDDYTKLSRGRFPLHSPLSLSLSARASSNSIPGTWGFGLWNDPFGLSLGFGGNPFRLPALPNSVWFFGASKESYLSFKAHRAERNEERTSRSAVEARDTNASLASAAPANGFLAQTFRSPKFHPLLIAAGLALPFSRKLTRRLIGIVIGEDGISLSRERSPLAPPARAGVARLPAQESTPYTLDVTQWHRYSLYWREDRVSFKVDDALVFESPVSPHPPLGLVIWIDNQYAAFTPEGKIGFGVLENPEPTWLEVKEIDVT